MIIYYILCNILWRLIIQHRNENGLVYCDQNKMIILIAIDNNKI